MATRGLICEYLSAEKSELSVKETDELRSVLLGDLLRNLRYDSHQAPMPCRVIVPRDADANTHAFIKWLNSTKIPGLPVDDAAIKASATEGVNTTPSIQAGAAGGVNTQPMPDTLRAAQVESQLRVKDINLNLKDTQHENTKAELKNTKEELKNTEVALQAANTALELARTREMSLDLQLRVAKAEKDAMSAKLQTMQTTIDEYRAEIHAVKTKATAQDVELADLRARVEKHRKEKRERLSATKPDDRLVHKRRRPSEPTEPSSDVVNMAMELMSNFLGTGSGQ